ncbi:hypothetical protein I656_00160 [Geobacillus sp. WSUCF1]|nr:hypothetical protein I656_00160 [Geobacillus sp. WSUCF1]
MLSLYAKAGISSYWLGWNTQAKNGELSPALCFSSMQDFGLMFTNDIPYCWFPP